MYYRVEGTPRMTMNEASESYPDSYVLMQKESRDTFDPIGIVLYVGDCFDELFALQVSDDIPLGIVVEGLNHRRSLGGVVVGA